MRTSKTEGSVCHSLLEWGTYKIQRRSKTVVGLGGRGMPKTQEKKSIHLRAKQLQGAGLVLHTWVAVPRMLSLHRLPHNLPVYFTAAPHSPATSGI